MVLAIPMSRRRTRMILVTSLTSRKASVPARLPPPSCPLRRATSATRGAILTPTVLGRTLLKTGPTRWSTSLTSVKQLAITRWSRLSPNAGQSIAPCPLSGRFLTPLTARSGPPIAAAIVASVLRLRRALPLSLCGGTGLAMANTPRTAALVSDASWLRVATQTCSLAPLPRFRSASASPTLIPASTSQLRNEGLAQPTALPLPPRLVCPPSARQLLQMLSSLRLRLCARVPPTRHHPIVRLLCRLSSLGLRLLLRRLSRRHLPSIRLLRLLSSLWLRPLDLTFFVAYGVLLLPWLASPFGCGSVSLPPPLDDQVSRRCGLAFPTPRLLRPSCWSMIQLLHLPCHPTSRSGALQSTSVRLL